MLTKAQIESYNQVRLKHARGLLCHAPFVSLNFEQNGNVSACCYNRSFSLGKIPDQSIEEIWLGKKADQLRGYIQQNDLSGGCSACQEVIQFGNYQGTKAIYYDEYAPKTSWKDKFKNIFTQSPDSLMPKLFEFELSNSCNLECVMCNGYFSSAIRKNRELLPPIKNHYNDDFVEQLTPYLPYLTDAKFLGGEPFLIDIYYKIWEKIIEINPKIKIHITTNGTVLSKKASGILEKLNAGIIISIDSLNKENYESIRVNAKLEDVLKNVEYFLKYTKSKGTYLSFAVCPIIGNRYDMPELLKFCNANDIHIHFNTVWTPEHTSLRFLGSHELKKVIRFYADFTFENNTKIQRENNTKFADFVSQLNAWLSESENNDQLSESIKIWKDAIIALDEDDVKNYPVLQLELEYYKGTEDVSKHKDALRKLYQKVGHDSFLNSFIKSMTFVSGKVLSLEESKQFEEKAEKILRIIRQAKDLKVVSEEMIGAGFVFQIYFIQRTDLQQIISLSENRFLKN